MGTHRGQAPRPVNRKILVGMVIGVTVAASVTAMASTGRGPVDQQTVEVGSASALDTNFKRDERLTAQQAKARAVDDAKASRTVQDLRKKLGESYAGAWLNSTERKLMVGVTDRTQLEVIRAAGAEPRLMRNSLTTLTKAKSKIDRSGRAIPSSVVSWYVDPPTNSVVVEAKKDPAADDFIDRMKAGTGDMMRVEWLQRGAQTFADLVGGRGFTIGDARCSIGFSATGQNGTKHILTAGHCTKDGDIALADGLELGRVSGSAFNTDGDFALIDITDPSATTSAFVDTRDGGPVTITGTEPAALGASVCRSGSTTGFACGEVIALDETVNYGDGNIVRGLTRTSVCAEPGDSGGSVISGTQAQGVISGGIGDCGSAGVTFFQPIVEAATKLGVTVVTL
ncbi:S1 family peptidase [Actinocrispum sp. NPDC049592]|uniref:S1 family peptidase n=1 Tax=Actinocrispum sp. NPDC049592 TaxID=3154835 RepID=UPI0034200DB9